jgi:hypothetical protein
MKKNAVSAKEAANKINEILLKANATQNEKEKEKAIELIKKYSIDYSNPIAQKTTTEELLKNSSPFGAVQPKEILSQYYGEKLPQELVSAGAYNVKNPVINPLSFARIFDYIPVSKNNLNETSYQLSPPMVFLDKTGEATAESRNMYSRWAGKNDLPHQQKFASDYFKSNSINPSFFVPDPKGSLEHEIGHHISLRDLNSKAASKAASNASIASNNFEDFGGHTGIPDETTQALSRFQREWFKEKKSRITNPNDFLSLVNSKEIPEFLSTEGKRILIYSKNLKQVIDSDQSKEKKKAAEEALKAISEMLPAVVQNKKQYGLKFNIS